MAVDIHFINDPTTLSIINAILELAGDDFNPPYDSSSQPADGRKRNKNKLVRYDMPGGSKIQGQAEPAKSQNMGTVINTILMILGPFISAYSLLLPVLGVLRGIIEIFCAMMNPFAVIAAIIRLFVKWIPPFISLFPPLAGGALIMNVVKLILALVYYILTEVVPTIQLIIDNINKAADAFATGNLAGLDAARDKLRRIIIDLQNRFGLFEILLPILEILFLILSLVTGFPCAGGPASDCSRGSLPRGGDEGFPCDQPDSNRGCPEVLKNPPKGSALLLPSFFGDSIPFFAYNVITLTGNENLSDILPYLQDLRSQLNEQLDEAVDEASPAGGEELSPAHFKIRITDKRGTTFVSPITKVNGNVITTINPILITKVGVVDYEIEPSYPMLIMRNIISLSCHPEVEQAIFQLNSRVGNLEISALDKYPEARNLLTDVQDLNNDLNNSLSSLNDIINGVEGDPPYDTAGAQAIQDDLVNRLLGFSNNLQGIMNAVLSRSADRIATELEVDKNIVKTGGNNKATVIVTPRDFSGAAIFSNLPDTVNMDVDIFTTFGTLSNKQRVDEAGQITMDLSSAFPGTAIVTAKINSQFISRFDGLNELPKTVQVQFVADSVLPKRRKISKVGVSTKANTGNTSEKRPGGK